MKTEELKKYGTIVLENGKVYLQFDYDIVDKNGEFLPEMEDMIEEIMNITKQSFVMENQIGDYCAHTICFI